MKQLLLSLAVLFSISAGVKAQCPVNVKYTAAKMEILDSTMTLQDSKDIVTVFETSEKGFTGTQEGNEDDQLHGALKSAKCDWKEAYVNGKIVMICDITDAHETVENATVTIEAKDGKITIILHAKEYPNRIIRLPVDKYEEVK